MNIICVDTNRLRLMKLWRDVLRVVPNANVQIFSEFGEVLRYVRSLRCGVLMVELNTDRAAWDGIYLVESVKKISPAIKIVFISSEPFEQNARVVQSVDCSGYIQRPYTDERLTDVLTLIRGGETSEAKG